MGRSVRSITVNFNAGTAKFSADVDRAKAKVIEFGSGTTNSVRAAGAAIRELEGNFGHNVRAVEVFLSSTLKLGPVLSAAFPLFGGIAFGGMVVDIGKKVHDFFEQIAQAPEKIRGGFRDATAGLQLTNDELRVANDRLLNDIAKLEGRHQNTLKLELDEARVVADRLGQSLEKDIAAVHKLLAENQVGRMTAFFTGQGATQDIAERLGGKTGFGGFSGEIAEKIATGRSAISAAKTPEQAQALEKQLGQVLTGAYDAQIEAFQKELEEAKERSVYKAPDTRLIQPQPGSMEGAYYAPVAGSGHGAEDQRARIESLQGALNALQEQRASIPLLVDNAGLSAKKESLNAAKDNAADDRPFENRMKLLAAQIDQVKEKLAAIGQPQAAQNMAKAFGEAQLAITETNKAMERHHTLLSLDEEIAIAALETVKVNAEAESEWRQKFVAGTASIQERIDSQKLLTAAIGQGYAATRAANVETRLMSELGQHFFDPEWMQQHAGDVSTLRTNYGAEFDTQHGQQTAQSVQKMNESIALERELARVQSEGAQAVRDATLALKLKQIARENDAASAKKLMAAEVALYNAERANAIAGEVAKVDEKTAATERLTAAITKGAAAVREATLANELAAIQREGDAPIPGVLGIGQRGMAAARGSSADYAKQVAEASAKTDRVQAIDDEITKLEDAKKTQEDTLAIEIQLRDLENQRLHALAEESLGLRGLRDGMRAFFIDMQQSAESAAKIVYDSMNSALNSSTSLLAKMSTSRPPKGGWGQEWGKELQQLGAQTTQASLKSLAQTGLGKLGKAFGVDIGGKTPKGTAVDPIWVRMAGFGAPAAAAGGSASVGDVRSIPGVGTFGSDVGGMTAKATGLAGILAKLFGRGSAAATSNAAMTGAPDVSIQEMQDMGLWGGFMAGGGDVLPGHVYMTGENGPEPFIPGSSGRILPTDALLGRGGGDTYHVDARGADLGAWNRIQRGLEMTGRAAVARSVQAMHERAQRTPSGG